MCCCVCCCVFDVYPFRVMCSVCVICVDSSLFVLACVVFGVFDVNTYSVFVLCNLNFVLHVYIYIHMYIHRLSV